MVAAAAAAAAAAAIWLCHMALPYGSAIWPYHMALPCSLAMRPCHISIDDMRSGAILNSSFGSRVTAGPCGISPCDYSVLKTGDAYSIPI